MVRPINAFEPKLHRYADNLLFFVLRVALAAWCGVECCQTAYPWTVLLSRCCRLGPGIYRARRSRSFSDVDQHFPNDNRPPASEATVARRGLFRGDHRGRVQQIDGYPRRLAQVSAPECPLAARWRVLAGKCRNGKLAGIARFRRSTTVGAMPWNKQ